MTLEEQIKLVSEASGIPEDVLLRFYNLPDSEKKQYLKINETTFMPEIHYEGFIMTYENMGYDF